MSHTFNVQFSFCLFLYRPAQQTTSPLHNELKGGAAPSVQVRGYQKSFLYLLIKNINSQLDFKSRPPYFTKNVRIRTQIVIHVQNIIQTLSKARIRTDEKIK